MMRRSRTRYLLPFVFASLLLHLQAVGIFKRIGDTRPRTPTRAPQSPSTSEVEFVSVPPREPPAEPTERPTEPTPEPPRRETVRRNPPTPERREQPTPTPPTPTPPPVLAQPVPTPPPTPRNPQQNMQSVDQQRNDQQPRPDDPAFLAQSNNNVREQTIAALRNLNRDDPDPQVGGQPQNNQSREQGNSQRSVSADSEERAGEDTPPNSGPNPNPISLSYQFTPSRERSSAQAPAVGSREAARPTESAPPPAPGAPAAAAQREPRIAMASVTSLEQHRTLTAETGEGSVQSGTSERQSDAGNPAADATAADPGASRTASTGGSNSGGQGTGGREGTEGSGAEAARRVGILGRGAEGAMAALAPQQSHYEQVFGAQAVEERRLAALRRSEARGSFSGNWRLNRAAIENFTPTVRVGNQTSLRTAASPFAAYLTAMHRRIHRTFSEGFIAGIENAPGDSPLSDPGLHTTIEIVLERDGRIARVGVVRTSGSTPFDVGSLNSVRRAAPFGAAPDAIVSPDGRVYVHWGFYRNERQCGTFNAEPFLLGANGSPPSTAPTARPPRTSGGG